MLTDGRFSPDGKWMAFHARTKRDHGAGLRGSPGWCASCGAIRDGSK